MRLCFVGDLIVDTDLDEGAARCARQLAGEHDLLIGNLEVPLCDENTGGRASKQVAWRAPRTVGASLRGAGVDAVSLANNHTTDWGAEGLLETLDVLAADRVGACGAGASITEACAPWRPTAGGLAVFSLSCTTPPGSAATTRHAGLLGLRVGTRYAVDTWRLEELPGTSPRVSGHFLQGEIEPLLDQMRAHVAAGDAVAVMVHWGTAWSPRLLDYQLDLAELLVDAGAGLVVGHHSHTVAPLGRYRDALVCFGVGDFLRSPALVGWGDQQRPGLAADFARHSNVGLAVSVDVDSGRLAGPRVTPLRVDASTGVPTRRLDDAEAGVLNGWLAWLATLDLDGRPGWTPAQDFAVPPRPFPLAAEAVP